MNDSEDLIVKARASEWGFIDFPRGRVLFMRLNAEQVVLVEPGGGFFYPYQEITHLVEMPDPETLASALSGVPTERLGGVAAYTREPRTMNEIETQFPGVEAWRLRRLGFLADVGRRQRRIISQWVGYDLSRLVSCIFDLAGAGTRNINS
jgi:hypothetical protein